jgi:hypothetical protein
VELRALIPPGLRERSGEVGDRVHVSYRFEGVEEGEAYVVEHHLYCTRDARGLIERADLLCSGFRPSSERA